MAASDAQIAANRANAQKSTGPTTEAGKSRSRGNAMKHGLTAQVIDLVASPLGPDQAGTMPVAAVTGRAFLGKLLTRTMTQMDRTQVIEDELRAEAVLRAQTVWDADRTAVVEQLALKLRRNPSAVVAELRRTPHGCAWLIYRWDILGRALRAPEGWTEAQTTLAFDLLGVPTEGRGVSVVEAFACRQYPPGPVLRPIEIVVEMMAELQEHQELVVVTDAKARDLAQADRVHLPTPALARVHHYGVALYRRFRHLIADLAAAPPEPTAPLDQPIPAPQVVAPPPVAPTKPAPVPAPLAWNPAIGARETNPMPGPVGRDRATDTLAITAARRPEPAPRRGQKPMPPRSRR